MGMERGMQLRHRDNTPSSRYRSALAVSAAARVYVRGMRVELGLSDWGPLAAAFGEISSTIFTAVSRAINKTLVTMRTRLIKRIKEQLPALKSGDIRDCIKVTKTSSQTVALNAVGYRNHGSRDRGILTLIGRRPKLYDVGARPTPAGVAWTGSDGRHEIPHAFVATMKTGHVGAFLRKPGSAHRQVGDHWSQLPIRELHGPSVLTIFETTPEIVTETLEGGAEVFDHYLHQQVDLLAGVAGSEQLGFFKQSPGRLRAMGALAEAGQRGREITAGEAA